MTYLMDKSNKDTRLGRLDKIAFAERYPFNIPTRSYVVVHGSVYYLDHFNIESPLSSIVTLGNGRPVSISEIDVAKDCRFLPFVSFGSNAAEDQLIRKFNVLDMKYPIFCVKGIVEDIVPVYSSHFARYGSIPATGYFEAGARSLLFCVFLPEPLVSTMHKSEAVGSNYGFFEIEKGFSFQDTGHINSFYGYLSLRGILRIGGDAIRLGAFSSEGSALKPMTESLVLRSVHKSIGSELGYEDFMIRILDDSQFRSEMSDRLYRATDRQENIVFARRIL